MKNNILDSLVLKNIISDYSYKIFDEEGNEGEGRYRNTEQVTLTFRDGTVLVFDTFCSGCREDTSLVITKG